MGGTCATDWRVQCREKYAWEKIEEGKIMKLDKPYFDNNLTSTSEARREQFEGIPGGGFSVGLHIFT